MQIKATVLVSSVMTLFFATSAFAECTGSNGRGWGSGKGNGAFEMAAGDKSCLIRFPGFGSGNSERIPASEVKLTTAPKSGKIGVSANGVVYTPNPGFKGKDKFCTRNTSAKVKGETLSGCVTVTVK